VWWLPDREITLSLPGRRLRLLRLLLPVLLLLLLLLA
jgi:hypothetical protein